MRLLLFVFGFLCCFCAHAQDSTLTVNLSLTLSGSTGSTPFWMRARQNGTIPTANHFVSGQWGLYKIYHPHNPRLFQWTAGAELITNYAKKGDVFFTDLYIAGKLGGFELLAGQKKNIVSLIDSSLGTGSLSLSGNARPFPRIQISTPEFQPLNFTDGFVSVKGALSEGMLGASNIYFGSASAVPNTYFHHKQLYFRLGKYSDPLKVYFGMNHQAVWGGENQIAPILNTTSLKSYWNVLTGKSINHRKVGSNFGTTDLAIDFRVKNLKFFVYRNNIHENSSLFKIINFSDGLNGVTVRKENQRVKEKYFFIFNSINFEYLSLNNQKNQFHPQELVVNKIADYYNSYLYTRGWSNYGLSMGTPFVLANNQTNENLPERTNQFTNNNRIQVFHTALKWKMYKTELTFKGTYSTSSGTYLLPFSTAVNQLSLFIGAEQQLRIIKGKITAGIASDIGKLYPNSMALFIGVRKSAFLN
ncbi:capsule assembly Wzi family protein [Dyadobacter diqingensis]|uniref:capsule assembly Wzi family protein n=1 Tax=Dyadobacter diqingensis TaxID=2938121 RepID=UPI0020C19E08|nr:capsule assembly Wzi family protein [Dyadobacter diqingensis]